MSKKKSAKSTSLLQTQSPPPAVARVAQQNPQRVGGAIINPGPQIKPPAIQPDPPPAQGGTAESLELQTFLLGGGETPQDAKEKFSRFIKAVTDLVCKQGGMLNRHRDHFLAERVNPFSEGRNSAREIISAILAFEDKFDQLLGMKS
jgi:hypothetical protein